MKEWEAFIQEAATSKLPVDERVRRLDDMELEIMGDPDLGHEERGLLDDLIETYREKLRKP